MTKEERRIYKRKWYLKNKEKVSVYNSEYRKEQSEFNNFIQNKYGKEN